MKTKHKLSGLRKSMLALPLTALLMTGCGSGSDPAGIMPLSGVVVDGYLNGATVFIDLNGDKRLNEGEPYTLSDANGIYTLDTSSISFPLTGMTVIASGGTDTDTGLPFEGQLMQGIESELANQILSPFNTLASVMVEKKITSDLSGALALISEKLGFSPTDIVADPVKLRDSKPQLFANQFALQQALQLMAKANADPTASPHQNQYRMMENFANALRNQNQNSDLGDCILAMNLNQANIASEFAVRLRDSVQLALRDDDPARKRETLRTLLRTMTQLRIQLNDCDGCQLINESTRLEQQLQLQAGAISGLIDNDPANDAVSIEKIRTRNGQTWN